jgi:ABC-type multidrug transport system, ATPase component
MIEIKGLTKSFGTKEVLHGIDLTIQNGELFGFIGHNGAGKTTTIRAMVGILDFEEGSITINGKSIKDQAKEVKKELAYIPDNPDLYPNLTGEKYLNFIADIFEVNTETRTTLIKKYADEFELTANLGDIISSYSHGMRQKLALISAFIHNPKVLILDEPFVGLDPKASHTLKNMMRELCEQGGIVFFSTHVLEVVEKLCDRVAIIKDGTIVVNGITEEVVGQKSLEEVFLELITHE